MGNSNAPYTWSEIRLVISEGRYLFRPVLWLLLVANVAFLLVNVFMPGLLLDRGSEYVVRAYYFDPALRVQGSALTHHVFTPEFLGQLADELQLDPDAPDGPLSRIGIEYSAGERMLELIYRTTGPEDDFLSRVIPLVNRRVAQVFSGQYQLDRQLFSRDGFVAGTLGFTVPDELANFGPLIQLVTLEQYQRLFNEYNARPDSSGTVGTSQRWLQQYLVNSERRKTELMNQYVPFAVELGLSEQEALDYVEYRKSVAWESLYFSVGSSALSPIPAAFPDRMVVTELGLEVWQLVVLALSASSLVLLAVFFLTILLKLYRQAGGAP
jgi:hypothetical protein